MENFIDIIPVELLAGIVLLLILAIVIGLLVAFLRRPRPEKLALVQEWLLWAVARAESYLGSGRGEQKLAMVYCWFEMRFPVLCKVIAFDQFQGMVDDALEQLEQFLLDDALMDMILQEVEADE